jgi:hypothetical protein
VKLKVVAIIPHSSGTKMGNGQWAILTTLKHSPAGVNALAVIWQSKCEFG